MLETPRSILRAEEVAALVMGTSDLTKELRARHPRERHPLLASLGWCVLGGEQIVGSNDRLRVRR
jgi:citrate lyase beta subunit